MKKSSFVVFSFLIHHSLVFGMGQPPVIPQVEKPANVVTLTQQVQELLKTPEDDDHEFDSLFREGVVSLDKDKESSWSEIPSYPKLQTASSSLRFRARDIVPDCFDPLELQFRDAVFLIKVPPSVGTRELKHNIEIALDILGDQPEYVLTPPGPETGMYIFSLKNPKALKTEARKGIVRQMRSDLRGLASISGIVIHCDPVDVFVY